MECHCEALSAPQVANWDVTSTVLRLATPTFLAPPLFSFFFLNQYLWTLPFIVLTLSPGSQQVKHAASSPISRYLLH
jgi:hypothetical protein